MATTTTPTSRSRRPRLWVRCEPCRGIGGDESTGTTCYTCGGLGQVDVVDAVRGFAGVPA